MNTLHVIFVAALLSASSSYADAAPDWTAAIGTGHAANGNVTASLATASGVSSSPRWSAFIGTGHVNAATHLSPATSATSRPVAAALHWTAKIGTGRAAESNASIGSSATARRTRS